MSWKEKGLELDFTAKIPECKRVGNKNEGYEITINQFLESKQEKALLKKPKDIKLESLRLGLKSTIKRMGVDDNVKASILSGNLYIYTKPYSDKQRWQWSIKRKSQKLPKIPGSKV